MLLRQKLKQKALQSFKSSIYEVILLLKCFVIVLKIMIYINNPQICFATLKLQISYPKTLFCLFVEMIKLCSRISVILICIYNFEFDVSSRDNLIKEKVFFE